MPPMTTFIVQLRNAEGCVREYAVEAAAEDAAMAMAESSCGEGWSAVSVKDANAGRNA